MQNKVVTFRLSESEFKHISVHAARAGLSISASVRAIVIDQIEDKSAKEILRKLDSILSETTKTKSTKTEPDTQVLGIRNALVGLIENVFLPSAPTDRKPQIKEILTILKSE
jgi:hypothetical protein